MPISQIGEKGGGGDDVSSDEDDEQQNEDDDDDDDGPGNPQSSPIFRCSIGHLSSSIANETSLCLYQTVEVGFRQNILTYLLGLVALTIFLTVAALVFKIWEREWTFLDAFYFSFVTMTTVGFGDMVPSESSISSTSNKICSMIHVTNTRPCGRASAPNSR